MESNEEIVIGPGVTEANEAAASQTGEPNSFKPGDLVQLKSGGPVMTVHSIWKDRLYAAWFAYRRHHRSDFNPISLQRAEAPRAEPRPPASV